MQPRDVTSAFEERNSVAEGKNPSAATGRVPLLSVVIVTWNSENFIGGCLQAVQRAIAGLDAEVIVVDNGSRDGTVVRVRETHPWVRLLSLGANVGFARANNDALRVAHGEHVLLLNPDTVPSEGAITASLGALRRFPRVGIVGCRVVGGDGELQMECAQRLPALRDVVIETFYLHVLLPKSRIFGRHRMSYWDHSDDRRVECIGGAFMMIRRSVIEQVGFLDETFFMYYEDLEFCARAGRAGWLVQYLGGPVVVHYGGMSRAQSVIEFDGQTPLSRYLYFKKYRGRAAALVFRGLCVMQSAVRLTLALAVAPARQFLPGAGRRLAFRPSVHWNRLRWGLGATRLGDVVCPPAEVANCRRGE